MDPNQFGFMLDSCTTFALISMLHHWFEVTDGTGAHVRAALLNYKKAFDLVHHNLLIAKLFSLGAKPTIFTFYETDINMSNLIFIASRISNQSRPEPHREPGSAHGSFW